VHGDKLQNPGRRLLDDSLALWLQSEPEKQTWLNLLLWNDGTICKLCNQLLLGLILVNLDHEGICVLDLVRLTNRRNSQTSGWLVNGIIRASFEE
jgi:hypothetical protein